MKVLLRFLKKLAPVFFCIGLLVYIAVFAFVVYHYLPTRPKTPGEMTACLATLSILGAISGVVVFALIASLNEMAIKFIRWVKKQWKEATTEIAKEEKKFPTLPTMIPTAPNVTANGHVTGRYALLEGERPIPEDDRPIDYFHIDKETKTNIFTQAEKELAKKGSDSTSQSRKNDDKNSEAPGVSRYKIAVESSKEKEQKQS